MKDFEKYKKEIEKLNFSIADEAKAITVWAFRNNPTLEYVHQGDEHNIPDNISRIKEDEMKSIMKHAFDYVSFFLWLKENRKLTYNIFIYLGLQMTIGWDKPRNPWNMYQELLNNNYGFQSNTKN